MSESYVRISAVFERPELADGTVSRLKRMGAVSCRVTNRVKRDNTLPFNRPLKPEYLTGTQMSYLSGFPHITSGGPLYDGLFEPADDMSATLTCRIPSDKLNVAKSAIFQSGGIDLKLL